MTVNVSKSAINLRAELAAIGGIATKTENDLENAMRDRFIDEAISAKKTVTPVDVFIYDTSFDSDGGDWRYRTQHTSWYNEELNTATRGSRREFPAVAVIVAESNKVTIYDGDDPSLPMWLIANRPASAIATSWWPWSTAIATSIAAKNAVIGFTSTSSQSFYAIDLLKDYSHVFRATQDKKRTSTSLADRDSSATLVAVNANRIVNNNLNDCALTILPDAGTDPATGLQYVTAAVATDGNGTYSTSLIKNIGSPDEVVYDIASDSTGTAVAVDFSGTELSVVRSDGTVYQWGDAGAIAADGASPDSTYSASSDPALLGTAADINGNSAIGSSTGLTLLDPDKGECTYITSDYNTGIQPAGIKLATLADTDTNSIVGAELVTNGTFDTDSDWTKGTGWTISGGTASSDGTQTGDADLEQTITTVSGTSYVVQFTLSGYSAGNVALVIDSTEHIADKAANGTYSATFVASSTSHTVKVRADADFVGDIDDVTVREAVPDRSVNANGLAVYGTITRTAVNTGNDLVAYSGFSAANYLQQPYNSDLDFGTGDFYVMGWVKLSSTPGGNQYILERSSISDSSSRRIEILVKSSKTFQFVLAGSYSLTTSAIATSQWAFLTLVRQGGNLRAYLNSNLEASRSDVAAYDCTDTSAVLGVGIRTYYDPPNTPFSSGSISLLRIGAGALTADEIRAIYEAERPLFQAGAQATLYGSSDAVTALAHDPVTDLLHVGSSAGRSVFQGLQRVDNTTTAVAAAISANDNLVVEG